MVNRINQVMELADGKKYVIMKQAVYKGDNYFVAARLTDDEEDVLEEFVVLKEIVNDNNSSVEKVKDPAIVELICKNVFVD